MEMVDYGRVRVSIQSQYLVDGIAALCHESHEGVASLVKGRHSHRLRGYDGALALYG